jgi:hypothetical protein
VYCQNKNIKIIDASEGDSVPVFRKGKGFYIILNVPANADTVSL